MDTKTTAQPLSVGLKTTVIFPYRWEASTSREVEAVNVCDLLEVLYPGYWEKELYTTITYESSRERIESWCTDHGAIYYARGREEFSLYEAAAEAMERGLTRVVYEDLS